MKNIDRRRRVLKLRASINPINYHYRMAASKREISVQVLIRAIRAVECSPSCRTGSKRNAAWIDRRGKKRRGY